MKTATGLALLAVGAILVFAVNAEIPGFNIAVAGWVVMLTGAAGMLVPAQAAGWLRRRIVLHSPVIEKIDRDPYPPHVMRDPAALAAKILRDAQMAAEDPRLLPAGPTGRDLDVAGITLQELFDERPEPAT